MGLDGILLLDKPVGITSARAVAVVKRALGGIKTGHLGTLDPFASGLLPLCVGEGTKIARYLNLADKSYRGTLRLGVTTDTLDRTGTETSRAQVPEASGIDLDALAAAFRGEQEQVPPAFSAIKTDGVASYKRARRGEEVEHAPRKVRIDTLRLWQAGPGLLGLEMSCSKGTYVRSLARDIGERIGCGAVLESLERTRFEPFGLDDAVALADIESDGAVAAERGVLSPETALASLPNFEVDALVAGELRAGRQGCLSRLPGPEAGQGHACVLHEGALVAVVAREPFGWKIDRVFTGSRV